LTAAAASPLFVDAIIVFRIPLSSSSSAQRCQRQLLCFSADQCRG